MRPTNFLLKCFCIAVSFFVFATRVSAQLTGTKTIPGDYSTISAAVAALNVSGVGSGGVTFNIAANYTETITATISLTATGTATNPIIFQKDPSTTGANPLITAYTGGTATPASSVQDGIWRLSGVDYIAINGIDVRDNPSNTTNPSTMEYGYALYKANAANGCQYVIIENCTVTLNSINNANDVNPMTEGCAGIIVMNATALAATVVLAPTAANGANSYNKFYGNTIQNCNIGISMIGATVASPFTLADTNNDIGGNSAATGNTIINYGGAPGGTNPAAAIRTLSQYGLNVSYNTINNNNGAGANHPATLRGIYINTALSANTTISSNTVTLNGGGTTQNITAIENAAGSTAAGNIININNNTIINGTYSTATTGNFYGIYNSASSSILNINNNTIAGNSTATLTGLYEPILNLGAVSNAININYNNIGNATTGAVTFNAANSSAQAFINNTAGGSSAALSISNNNFQGIVYGVQGTGPNTYISNTAATLSQAINSNTFTSLNVNTTGNITFIANSIIASSSCTQNINNNSIVNSFNKPGDGGNVTLFTSTASSVSGSVSNNNNNNFSNITIVGTTVMNGWVNTDAGVSNKTIQNNTFSNWVAGTGAVNGMNINLNGVNNAVSGNAINNVSGAGTITGIVTAFGNDNIYSNTIDMLTTTGAVAVTGILVTAGTTKNIYSNKIYGLQANNAGGTVNGITVSGTTVATANIYNNTIGDLRAPFANTTTDVIRGVNIIATAANSNINVYYNTIYLNASSTGTNFSSSGIYHTVSATATTAALNLRNNSITNISTPSGSGISVAYRRSGIALNNYAAASNNNLFYAGSPASNRLIFYDGTNADQLLSAYKTRVATRDVQSITEDLSNSKFLSTSGSSVSYLRMDPSKASLVESGAVNITGFNNDEDADTRQGNIGYTGTDALPDIGADEYEGIKATALSGSYNVGAGQPYSSLTGAGGLFAAINSLGLSGNIIVNITSDLSEDGTNTLYKWVETGAGNYTVTIQPDASTLRVISGDVLAGLIRFNNASRIIIDGSYGTANNHLTFKNLNASGTTGAAFTFINGATNNTIRYCNVEAYTNATTGVIFFNTSSIAGGNSNNTISNCNINATVNSNTGNVCIYSSGTIGNENSANSISNNIIYNYRDRALDITSGGSSAWVISGNSFYNGDVSGAINYAAGATLHCIRILGGAGYSVLNNYIGGNAILASGTNAVYSSTLGILSYQGILLTTSSATPVSYIKGNTIASISVSAVPTSATAANIFIGIEANGSGVNIGGNATGDGNTIGTNTANASIIITTTTALSTYKTIIRGIDCNSNGGLIIGNQVAGIDIKNLGAPAAPSTFIGIYVNGAAAPSMVNNNIIGSTGTGAASNSIRVLSSSTSATTALTGISIGGAVVSTVQVNGNLIQNISHQSATAFGVFTGISNSATGAAVIVITNNTVSANTNNASAGSFFGIYSNLSPASLTINNNSILNNSSTATASGFLYGIYTSGIPTTIVINNNTFSSNSSTVLTTAGFVGIYNVATPSALTINNNTFYSNTLNSTTGSFYSIYNSGAVTTSININNNSIGTNSASAVTYSVANSTIQYFINNTGGAGTAALSISNNNFLGITNTVTATGNDYLILNSAAMLSQAINGNKFTNLNINTSGNVTFISDNVVLPATGIQNINNNSIAGTFTKTAGGTVTLFTSTSNSTAGSITNNNNNNFSNITVAGATIIAGWVNTDAGSSAKTIQNNIFSNWVGGTSSVTALAVNISGTTNATTGNLINNISNGAAITGIATGAGNDNIYSNIIDTLSTTAAAAVTAISVTAGTAKNIYKNKIYDLSGSNAGSSVNGILIAAGATVTVYNNLIGNLRATAASSSTDLIRGVNITSTAASSTINVYYNTIYLNASSTGTNFSTTGIYHTTNATATTATLNLKNNCIVNTSTPKGTGITVAYRRSGSALTNYAATSNNNLFYAGTPGTSRLIYYDATNSDQTLTAYRSRVSTRDAASVTEDETSKFSSTLGSSAVFLHINSVTTLLESGGANISGITDDIDGQVRAGNTGYTGASSSPDIGADEVFGLETVPPTITYTSLSNTTSTTNRSVTGITITDASGINNNAGTKPRIYYKRFNDANSFLDNTSSTNGWKYTEATNSTSPYTFTIDYTLLYGGSAVTAGVMQYFMVGQDLATTANVAVNSGTFANAPSSVALTTTAFPIGGTINSYNIPFSGTYNVGSAEVFTSLTKADGLFASINTAGLMGNTTFNITSDIIEDGANALNQWTESGVGNYTLAIQPDVATLRAISGNVATGMIRLNGADRVTIDGANAGSGSYLSFKNTNTAGATGTAFAFTNGAANNTIRYCDIEAYADATDGVILFGTSSVGGGNSNNLIDNCIINATANNNSGNVAIYSAGTIGNENSSNTISNNSIYNYRDRAVDIASTGSSAWIFSNNSFYNGSISASINYAAASTLHGIRILGGSGYSILNNYIGGNTALASGTNAIYSSTSGNLSYQGILLTTSSSSPTSYIKGNTIAGISLYSVPTGPSSNVFTGIETNGGGINIGGTSAGEGNMIGSAISNNSVAITTTTSSISNTSLIKAINCSSNGGLIDGNQIGGIDISNIGSSPASSSFYGIYINSATAPSEVNNNIIGSSSTLSSLRVLSTSSAAATSLTGISIGPAVNSTMLVKNNAIENISNLSVVSSGSFTGINNSASSGAAITISNDTIQNISTAANSGSSVYSGIVASSASTISDNWINNIILASTGINAQITGINVSGAFAHTISGNTITALSAASAKVTASVETATPASSAIIGILNAATVAGQVISNNILSGLSATTSSSLNTMVTGIGITATVSGNIYNNRLSNFTNAARGTSPGICGIMAYSGSFNVYNNSIQVSNTSSLDNTSNVNGVKIYGIDHATTNNWNYYYNTISVSGRSTGTAMRSAAFIRSVNGASALRNNVFVNTRTGAGSNYAISNIVAPASTAWAATASDYNDVFSSNTNTTGEWGVLTNTFTQWQTSSGGETHSVSHSAGFVSSLYDLVPDSTTNCSLNNSGISIASPVLINTDINNVSRNSSHPDMGAYEFNYNVFAVTAGNSSPVCSGSTINFTSDAGNAVSPIYSWANPNYTIVASTQNPGIAVSVPGSYTVTVTDNNGCADSAVTVVSLNTNPTGVVSGSTSICSGSSTTINITVTGSGIINGLLNNGDPFSGTAPTISVTESPATNTAYTIATMSDAGCSSQPANLTGNAVITVTKGFWNGSSSTDWNNAANWCGGVPSTTTDVIIPAGLSNYPLISSTATAHSINIVAGASLTIAASTTLTVPGAFNDSGTLVNNGTIVLNGSSTQSFPGSSAAITAMNNLQVNNPAGVIINKPLVITGSIIPTAGIIDLTTNDITLYSDAANTASVASAGGSFVYTGGGKFIVQRYIPARRSWRLMTAPVINSPTIYNSWQNGGLYSPGAGTFISGTTGGSGLDKIGNASMYTYNSSTQKFTGVNNTNVNISAGNNGSADNTGYFIFVRGDRSLANYTPPNDNVTTLSCSGKLQTGTQIFTTASVAGNYTLIGNPYASPIDFNTLGRANLVKRFYAWDPSLNTVGGFVVLDDLDNDGAFSSSVSNSAQGKNIQSGQGFFVQTMSNGAASLTVNENNKSTVNNNLVFRPTSATDDLRIYLDLLNDDSTVKLADGIYAEFNNNFSDSVNWQDALKFSNINEDLSFLRYNKSLAIERRPLLGGTDTMFLKLLRATQRKYRFRFISNSTARPYLRGILEDSYTGISSIINLGGDASVDFSVTADTASINPNRFRIVFRPPVLVPLTFIAVDAYTDNTAININWKVANEINVAKYEIERSADGKQFSPIGSILVSGSNPFKEYTWVDKGPESVNRFYRIAGIDNNGKLQYSKVVKITESASTSGISIYQNPVIDNMLELKMDNMPANIYKAHLLNSVGQIIQTVTINHYGGTTIEKISLDKNLAKGIYQLKFYPAAGKEISISFLK